MISAHLSDKAKRNIKIYVEQFPVTEYQKSETSMGLEILVGELLSLMNNRSISDKKNASSEITDYLNRIDSLVYKLYGLNEDDIKIINKTLEQ
jgi:ABC-type phosphate transport system auxiliary subunit